jgi:hypothetical protein
MLAWFRRAVRSVNQNIWLAVLGLGVLALVALSLAREGSGADPEVVQLTIDAVSTQSNLYVPTLASQLTQTPVEAALTGAAPTLVLLGAQEIHQFAASASADSEPDPRDGGAVQATGPPNTEGCIDARTAWSTADPNGQGTLTLLYPQLVTPTGIRVHQTYNPGFIVRIIFIDLYGEMHTVYEGTPQPASQCPLVLDVSITDANYEGNVVAIFVDQTTSSGGWNQIDAAELIGVKH